MSTLRARWVSFAAALVALALGVGVIATVALVMNSALTGFSHERAALTGTVVLLGVSAGVTGFATVFIVASTFALTVIQRTRELALLRLVGATPRQVRRMILVEALLLAGAGCAIGVLISMAGAPVLAAVLVSGDMAPSWFKVSISPVPLVLACLAGLAVTALSVSAASRRAATIRPTQSLREAAGDPPRSHRGRSARTAWGIALLVISLMGMGVVATVLPEIAMVPVIYLWVLLALVAAVALLAPALIPPILKLLTLPWARGGSAIGTLVRENTLSMARRTAATALPILITAGMSISLLGALETIGQAQVAEAGSRLRADYVLVPSGDAMISAKALEQARSIPGVQIAALAPVTVRSTIEPGGTDEFEGYATDSAQFAAMTSLPLTSGSLRDLGPGGIVVSERWELGVGQRVRITPGNGKPLSLTVVAVVGSGTGGADFYLDASHGGASAAEVAYVTATSGAAAELGEKSAELGATLLTKSQWAGTAAGGDQGTSAIGMMVTLGIAIVYSCVAIVNTMVMAATGRRRDLAMLRLVGATSRQAVAALLAESIVVVAAAMVPAAGASAVNFAGLLAALTRIVPGASLAIPWAPVLALAATSALLAVLATTLTAMAALRTPALVSE
ncbi:ABC transporter permease [Sphaerisporangium krabiense]|uniref:Putative ABC transport system permease protein n=1 Tax=Sphaerisporangium krabiense TaxID=763782 RepID=A0A7W9DNH4_9ACTN|nr:FtsX-like permease family protein [Sphaerisporangium krabiense]MBB5625387.1 putative ABC transport system permease protein [Sphaerisporangium krabiense]